MIYNFNLGIGWASSGVEYAQSYRAAMFRKIGADAKFVFTDMISSENIEHFTRNIGFHDSEIIWLYTFFTDQKIAPVTYTIDDLKKTLHSDQYTYTRDGKVGRLVFQDQNSFYTIYFVDKQSDLVHRVEIVSRGSLPMAGPFRNTMPLWIIKPICIYADFLTRTGPWPMRRSTMTGR